MLTLLRDELATPIGRVILAADEQGALRILDWTDHEERMLRLARQQNEGAALDWRPSKNPHRLTDALAAYFAGDLTALDAIPVATGGTVFQREVWAALRSVPAGATISYLDLAVRIGRPMAVRAVGLANGANPISIVVPCHRIIGSGGQLTGYGGGLHRKRWLLDHEDPHADARLL